MGLQDHALRVAHRVGDELCGVVRIVGAALAGFEAGIGPRQLATAVGAHELAVGAHPYGAPDVLRGQGVQRLVELDVVVRVDFALLPRRRIETLGDERAERSLLEGGEDDQRLLPGGPVATLARHLGAPANGVAAHVIQVEPRLAAKETLANVLDVAFHLRLAGGMTHHGRVDHEAAVRGVLVEGALEDRIVAVGLGHRRPQIVDDDPPRHAAEVFPGVLEALDEIAVNCPGFPGDRFT